MTVAGDPSTPGPVGPLGTGQLGPRRTFAEGSRVLSGGIMQLTSAQVAPITRGAPDEYGLLVRQIVENPVLNGEVIRLDGLLRMWAR